MSRIRTIKPDSALSETLESVSVTAALLFARLPCFTDDEGRMRYSPALIKAQVFPLHRGSEEVPMHSGVRGASEGEPSTSFAASRTPCRQPKHPLCSRTYQ